MTPEVETAIQEVRDTFPDLLVEVTPEVQGGAYVVVGNLWIGDQYEPTTSWVGFLIPFTYPRADCYPHFLEGGIRRRDGRPLGDAITATTWNRRSALQVSRRSNHWNPSTDTAAAKLLKVLEWVRARP